jgi:hypothetical protein
MGRLGFRPEYYQCAPSVKRHHHSQRNSGCRDQRHRLPAHRFDLHKQISPLIMGGEGGGKRAKAKVAQLSGQREKVGEAFHVCLFC